MNDDHKIELHDSPENSKPTHSVVDSNDLQLCIQNSQESPQSSMDDQAARGSASKSPPVTTFRANPMTEEMEVLLIELVKDKMLQFNLSRPVFKPDIWQTITADFNESFLTSFGFTQLRTKLNNMKSDWRIWNRIKCQTGVGWDSDNQVFACPDWDLLEQQVKGAKKFAAKRLPHFDALTELFMGSGATGRRGTTPRFTFPEIDADYVDLNVDEDIDLGNDDNDSPTIAKSSLKRKYGDGPSTNTQRASKASKRSSTDRSTFSGGSMDVSHAVHNVLMEKSTYDPTEAAVKLLETMNLDDAMYLKAFQWLIESRSNASAFLSTSEQHRRLWIQKLLEK